MAPRKSLRDREHIRISATAVPLCEFRTVPRRAIALLRMTILSLGNEEIDRSFW